jgi:hypothetical protein
LYSFKQQQQKKGFIPITIENTKEKEITVPNDRQFVSFLIHNTFKMPYSEGYDILLDTLMPNSQGFNFNKCIYLVNVNDPVNDEFTSDICMKTYVRVFKSESKFILHVNRTQLPNPTSLLTFKLKPVISGCHFQDHRQLTFENDLPIIYHQNQEHQSCEYRIELTRDSSSMVSLNIQDFPIETNECETFVDIRTGQSSDELNEKAFIDDSKVLSNFGTQFLIDQKFVYIKISNCMINTPIKIKLNSVQSKISFLFLFLF